MKIIEALKKTKELEKKADDLVDKIKKHSAITNVQTPEYPDQKEQVRGWVQAQADVIKEIERLRLAIQRTNLDTVVGIEVGGKVVSKSIAAWIHRRRDLSAKQLAAWKALTDRGIVEGIAKSPTGDAMEIKVLRFYDPKERDGMMEIFTTEPGIIDSRLEVVNAVTDLIE